jgi:hypothetical protein
LGRFVGDNLGDHALGNVFNNKSCRTSRQCKFVSAPSTMASKRFAATDFAMTNVVDQVRLGHVDSITATEMV